MKGAAAGGWPAGRGSIAIASRERVGCLARRERLCHHAVTPRVDARACALATPWRDSDRAPEAGPPDRAALWFLRWSSRCGASPEGHPATGRGGGPARPIAASWEPSGHRAPDRRRSIRGRRLWRETRRLSELRGATGSRIAARTTAAAPG